MSKLSAIGLIGNIDPQHGGHLFQGVPKPTVGDCQIEFASGCLYQPNAVELSTGVIVFDACGACPSCSNHGLKGSACKDGVMIRKATDYEVAQQTRVIIVG